MMEVPTPQDVRSRQVQALQKALIDLVIEEGRILYLGVNRERYNAWVEAGYRNAWLKAGWDVIYDYGEIQIIEKE